MIAIDGRPGLDLVTQLVRATGWTGNAARVAEAAPHLVETLSPGDMVATLRNLDIPIVIVDDVRMAAVSARDCPCLCIPDQGAPMVLLDVRDGALLAAVDGGAPEWIAPGQGRARTIHARPADEIRPSLRDRTLGEIVRSFRGHFGLLAATSVCANALGFAAPLLVMVIYDRLIPSRSIDLLLSLVLGMAGVLAAEFAIRLIRGRGIAWMGARIEHRMGLAVFRKLAMLPTAQIEKSGVEQQIARLRQFEGLRGVFNGPLLSTVLDLPFSLFFLAVIWMISPPIGLLILALMGVFLLAVVATSPAQVRLNAESASARDAISSLTIEASMHQRDIQRLGIAQTWRARSAAASARAASSARRARQFQLSCQTFGQSVMLVAGVGAVVLGTREALAGDVSFGGLIALIALTWKVLGPIQTIYASAPQAAGYLRTMRRVDALLGMPEERRLGPARSRTKAFRGDVRVAGLGHRFGPHADPALSGVGLDIRAGEMVVVCGRNGAGKSTLLKMIDGLYAPSTGSLSLDGIDYRQIGVDDLRAAMSYVPQRTEFFHGSVLQNFRLAAPTATRGQVRFALEAVGLADEIDRLPEGLDTRLSEEVRRNLSDGILQGLSVARGLMREASVYLLDEPCSTLDRDHEAAFLKHVAQLRGWRTVVMVTDRPSHFDIADRFVFLDRGRVIVNETGAAGQRKVRALYSSMREGRS